VSRHGKLILVLVVAAAVLGLAWPHIASIRSLSSGARGPGNYMGGWELLTGIEHVEVAGYRYTTGTADVYTAGEPTTISYQKWYMDPDETHRGYPTFSVELNQIRYVDQYGDPQTRSTLEPVEAYMVERPTGDGEKEVDIFYLYLVEIQTSAKTWADVKLVEKGHTGWLGTVSYDAVYDSETSYYPREGVLPGWTIWRQDQHNGRELDLQVWYSLNVDPWLGRYYFPNGTEVRPSDAWAGVMSVQVPGRASQYGRYSPADPGDDTVNIRFHDPQFGWQSAEGFINERGEAELPSPEEDGGGYGFKIGAHDSPGSMLPMRYFEDDAPVSATPWMDGENWGPDPKIPSRVKFALSYSMLPGWKPSFNKPFGYVEDIAPVNVLAKTYIVAEVMVRNTYGPLATGISFDLADPKLHISPTPTPPGVEWLSNLLGNPLFWLGVGGFFFLVIIALSGLGLFWFFGPPRRRD
jgi:hypothetical protein